jgi:sugar phosphate isomerase/epimerase
MNPTFDPCSRRAFLGHATALAASIALPFTGDAASLDRCPIACFSKVYQELELDYDACAEVTAEAGLDGIDCPVRPGGQVLPERAAEDLPRYAEALQRRKLKILLLTTAILSPASPNAETILKTAKSLGVTHYRLGYWNYKNYPSREKLSAEAHAQLKDLAAMNRDLGLCGVYQNHSGRDNFGALVSDVREVISDIDPRQIGMAFDPSHAWIELGSGWREELERCRRHVQIAYAKDVGKNKEFVKFGEGMLGTSGWFTWLKQAGYARPVSMHTEYPWVPSGFHKTRERLVSALKSDLAQMKNWMREA